MNRFAFFVFVLPAVLVLAFFALWRVLAPPEGDIPVPQPRRGIDKEPPERRPGVRQKQAPEPPPVTELPPEPPEDPRLAPPPRDVIETISAKWSDRGFFVGRMTTWGGFYRPDGTPSDPKDVLMPGFEARGAVDLDMVRSLPQLPVPFGIHFSLYQVTDDALAELAGMKNLAVVYINDRHLTDGSLRTLRAAGRLHLLRNTFASREKRPASDAEVKRFSLHGSPDEPAPLTDDGLRELAAFANLESLELHETKATGAGLKHLAGLTKLTALAVSGRACTDDAPRAVAQLKSVTALRLFGGTMTDAGFAELGALPNLESLSLHSTKLTDIGLKGLVKARTLRHLDLTNCRITDAGARELAALTALESVRASVKVSPETAAALAKLPNLKRVALPVDAALLRAFHAAGRLHALEGVAYHYGRSEPVPAADADITIVNLPADATDDDLKLIAGLPNLRELGASATKVTATGAKSLAKLKKLEGLYLPPAAITDDVLAEFRAADRLHALSVFGLALEHGRPREAARVRTARLDATAVTGAGLKELAPLTALQSLTLSPAQITDASVKTLREMNLLHAIDRAKGWNERERPNRADDVQTLDLSGTGVGDAALKELAWLKGLTKLDLSGTKLTDDGLKQVVRLRALTELKLSNTGTSDAGLAHLKDAPKLTALDLSGTKVTDAGVLHLVALKELTALNLSGTAVTDDAVPELTELKKLQSLDVRKTDLSAAGLKELKARLPRCAIKDK